MGMAESKTEQMLEKVEKLYKKIMVLEAQTMKVMRTGSDEDVKRQLRRVKEECLGQQEGFALAMDWANIIATRFYVGKIDITEAMREKIYFEDAGRDSESWQLFLEAMELNERKHFNDYMEYAVVARTRKKSSKERLDHYLDLVKQVNEFTGEFEGEELYRSNVEKFRALVRKAVEAREDCALVAVFKKDYISTQDIYLTKRKNVSYEEACVLADNVIKNLAGYVYINEASINGKKVRREKLKNLKSLQEEGVESAELIEEFYDGNADMREEIEKSWTHFADDTGVGRKIIGNYFRDVSYRTFRKAALTLGIFFEPYANLGDCEEDTAVVHNLERFMNQNGLSMKSYFDTTTQYDNLLDYDVLGFLEYGYTHSMIAYCLRRFAKTKSGEKE